MRVAPDKGKDKAKEGESRRSARLSKDDDSASEGSKSSKSSKSQGGGKGKVPVASMAHGARA